MTLGPSPCVRRGEALGLKWDAIDFEQGTITITMNIYAHLDTTAKDVSAAAMSQALSLPEYNGGYGWQRN